MTPSRLGTQGANDDSPAAPQLNIVVPMAGLGQRFRDAGYLLPKPLIDVRGRPMYSWAVDSLPLERAANLIFVLLASEPGFETLRRDVVRRYATHNPVVLDVPEPTAGQAVTVLRARHLIDDDEPLLVHNADTSFSVDVGWDAAVWRDGYAGALLVFRSTESRWSYSREGDDGLVVEVREKKVISPWASTGSYWFRRGSDFVRLADAQVAARRSEASEYYVGPLYNDLIADGGRVKNVRVQSVRCFGTPADYLQNLETL